MSDILSLASENLLSPIILSFVLGLLAALARSDLTFPEAAAKALSIYLLFAIGFKGGVSVAGHGLDATLGATLLAGVALSAVLPFVAFALLRLMSRLDRLNAAAVAGHYGSISIVTFLAGSSLLAQRGVDAEGYMVAVAAVMEAPAILSALWIVSRGGESRFDANLLREILLNGSIVLLVGAFAIGWITGQDGMQKIQPFIGAPFQGVLCLFLLDMGLIAGRGLRRTRASLGMGVIAFGIVMPLLGSLAGLGAASLLGLSLGGTILLMILAASASYIAVPAAMRVAMPEADPSIYLTLSLGVTFPFNLAVGIPIYYALALVARGGF
ncbi:MAG: sodium-dependent bicarbonate transport family permease [Gammaproteobacteria bacterium]|nr:sodium-dependent bicarbonate transport family permease [Gammaproteobacteria bacterium]MBT8051148.1 sodium-dependent bicarbonate transport family permease [Gammaproteobacteria bacterium]MBT8056986.1 sodium-dependent bicarbonate transport family permease [Gammaproteobacteria bacterium]NNJ77673.1 sodium-dependent bicarbonate transport family permease [Xanthomonadales bacterium]